MSSREEVRNGCLGGTSPIWSQGVAFWTRCNKKEDGKEEGRNRAEIQKVIRTNLILLHVNILLFGYIYEN